MQTIIIEWDNELTGKMLNIQQVAKLLQNELENCERPSLFIGEEITMTGVTYTIEELPF